MYIGEKRISVTGHVGEIVAIHSYADIDVLIDGEFLREHIQYGNFERGRFGSKLQKRIAGVGCIGIGEYVSKNPDGSHTEAYRKWHDMLMRCYREKTLERNPLYKVVTVCDEWLNFQNFAKWFYENKIEVDEEIHIDKDIISGEQKIYSPDTCCIVPKTINMLFKRSRKRNVENKILPVGVGFQTNCINKYYAHVYKNGKTVHKCGFNSPEEAFQWYKDQKERHIKEVTELYKDILPKRTYDALMNYEVKPYPFTEEELTS